jgi:iron complex outermembrane receptor protein
MLLAGSALAAFAAPASAQTAGDDFHIEESREIIVTAPFRRERQEFLTGLSVLAGAELTRELRPTIGETLARLPGVSATSFGPNASRPVLRGLQGERIRVLTDGIGSFDVANTSADHATAVNPFLAERVEVLRGPAALQFGSSAIGGVVNVIDKRIPRTVPDEPVHVDAMGGYASAADQWFGAGSADMKIGDKVVLHVDGSYLDGDDLRIGSFVLSRRARAEALASPNPDVQALASLRNRLPNSAARTWDLAGGVAVITEGGNLGFAISRYDSLYGVPPRFDLETGEGEAPRLDVRQLRIDVRGELNLGGFFELARGRFGFADYKHDEIEPEGEIGSTFMNEAFEGRVELVQSQHGSWKGAVGGQFFIRAFDAIGEEAFLPKNETRQYGLFTLQQVDLGKVDIEVGGRAERTRVGADAVGVTRRFTALSGSIGANIEVATNWRVGLNLSHTERAPSAEELFSNGPHAGTQSFEVGDPTLRKESNLGIEATLRGSTEWLTVELSGYYNRFRNFIYQDATGEIEDELPVFAYAQERARFYGFEAQVAATVAQLGSARIGVDGVADYVRARIPGVGPVPRIPPLRLLGGVSATADRFSGRVEVEHSFAQNRTASFETPTDSFTLVNAQIGFRPFGTGPNKPELLVQANNIFDADARRHASFLKDFAPLAGRDVRVTLRASF